MRTGGASDSASGSAVARSHRERALQQHRMLEDAARGRRTLHAEAALQGGPADVSHHLLHAVPEALEHVHDRLLEMRASRSMV